MMVGLSRLVTDFYDIYLSLNRLSTGEGYDHTDFGKFHEKTPKVFYFRGFLNPFWISAALSYRQA
ncbi:MAG: hypothetical protein ACPGUX_08840, partial [Halocynthiibacter sp.]